MRTEFPSPGSPGRTPQKNSLSSGAQKSTLQQSAQEDAADAAFHRSVQGSLSHFWICAQILAVIVLGLILILQFR